MTSKKSIYLVFLLCFIILAFMAFCSPLAGDDYIYAFNDNSTVRPIRIIDIIWNIQTQRISTSARFISHFFVELFIMISKPLFNIVNAAVNTAGLYLVFLYFKEENKDAKNLYLLLGFVFMVWVFMPVFGEVYIWLDGACNYSWAIVLLMAFLLPYYKAYVHHSNAIKNINIVLFLICCPIMGAYSENGSAAGIMIAFFLMLLVIIRDKKIAWYLPAGFVLACGGYLFLISSPVISGKGDVSVGMLAKIAAKLSNIVSSIISRTGLLLFVVGIAVAIFFIVFAVYALKRKKFIKLLILLVTAVWFGAFLILLPEGAGSAWKTACAIISEPSENLITLSAVYGVLLLLAIYNRINIEKLLAAILMPAAGLVSVAVFMFAIYFPARSCCYFTILTSLSCTILISEMWDYSRSKVMRMAASGLTALFVICFAMGITDSISIASQHADKLEKINAAQMAGEKTIELHPYYYNTKYAEFFGIDNIGNAPCWLNHYMGMYYGFDDLIGID